jgi:hypothetical protein
MKIPKYTGLFIFGVLLAFSLIFLHQNPVSALALKMQPLIYKDTLKKGERKKGFVDISNPTGETLRLKTSVQGFRQIDDNGSLQFFDSPELTAGIKPDLDEFELGPRQSVRMYFQIDGIKIPSGDVFAALFVSTIPTEKSGSVSSLRLGTLFVLTNGTPGSRDAEITKLDVGFWQLGETVDGSFTVKNKAREGSATGFFPSVNVSIKPLDSTQKIDSKLVFAGRSRQSDFQISENRIGLYKVIAQYGDSKQGKLVFMVTGYWRGVVIAGVLLLLVAVAGWLTLRRRRPAKTGKKQRS